MCFLHHSVVFQQSMMLWKMATTNALLIHFKNCKVFSTSDVVKQEAQKNSGFQLHFGHPSNMSDAFATCLFLFDRMMLSAIVNECSLLHQDDECLLQSKKQCQSPLKKCAAMHLLPGRTHES